MLNANFEFAHGHRGQILQMLGPTTSVQVHRDVKGANLILAEREKRFKLLDLGAACDLFTRVNYDPQLQVRRARGESGAPKVPR